MAQKPSHYEVLGVAEDADADAIKKQFRALARRTHPDVNPGDEAAARLFTAVTEAYRILSDPDSRRTYDAERALAARAAARAASQAARPAASRPTASTPPPPPSSSTAPPQGYPAAQDSEQLVVQARRAFGQGRMVEARDFAERALRYNSRNAGAHEVLGDVCRQQGRTDEAAKHYTLCLQFDPRNVAVQSRLERLGRNGAPGPPPRRAAGVSSLPREKRPVAVSLAGFCGYGLSALLVLFCAMGDHSGPTRGTLSLSVVASWTWTLVAYLSGVGVVLGATQAITGSVRRVEDDFLFGGAFGGSSARGGSSVPMGLLILVVGAMSFYAAALVHLVTAMVQETLHRSLVWLYGTVVLATALLAVAYAPGPGETLLWGGNLVFLGHFVGRVLGDFFRID